MIGFGKISNLRIGWKLGLTSGLGVLLVVAMIVNQQIGSGSIKNGIADIERNDFNARLAVNTKASVRGMQIGMRDVRLATSAEDIAKAFDFVGTRYNATVKFADQLVERVKAPEQRERAQKVRAAIDTYYGAGKDMMALKKELLELQTKGNSSDSAARAAELNGKYAAIVRDRALPASQQLEALTQEMEDFATARATQNSRIVEQNIEFIDRLGLGIGVFVALVLI
jgi:hypothetical protein